MGHGVSIQDVNVRLLSDNLTHWTWKQGLLINETRGSHAWDGYFLTFFKVDLTRSVLNRSEWGAVCQRSNKRISVSWAVPLSGGKEIWAWKCDVVVSGEKCGQSCRRRGVHLVAWIRSHACKEVASREHDYSSVNIYLHQAIKVVSRGPLLLYFPSVSFMYKATHQVGPNLPLTYIWKLRFSIRTLYCRTQPSDQFQREVWSYLMCNPVVLCGWTPMTGMTTATTV